MKIRLPPRLLLIGPLPPPDRGTTIPFKLFNDYVESKFSQSYSISTVNATTGDKSSTSMFTPSIAIQVVKLTMRIIALSLQADRIVIFGSQRFVTLMGSLIIILTRPLGKPVYLRINGGGYEVFYKTSSKILQSVIRNVIGMAEGIIVQTELVREAMSEIWGNKVDAVSNYRELVHHSPSDRTYSKTRVRFIYTGIVRQLKGCRELLEAFVRLNQLLAQRGDDVETRLDLFGAHFDSPTEPLDISGFCQHSNIVFHGAVRNAELLEMYAESDVLVLPSYWPTEGHPGSVVEAFMHGLPVIATNWRAIPEIVDDGSNGVLCAPRDVDSLLQAMYTLATDFDRRRLISKAAYESARQFDHNVVCADLAARFGLSPGPACAA